MPKVNYSTTKGLYQESGSNLALTGGSLSYKRPVVALSDAGAATIIRGDLLVTESGTIFTVPALTTGTQTVTLPALATATVGCTYTFVAIATVGQDMNVLGASSDKILAVVPKGDGDNTAASQAYDSIGFDANAILGTAFSITCISTTAATGWLVHDVIDGLALNTGGLNVA